MYREVHVLHSKLVPPPHPHPPGNEGEGGRVSDRSFVLTFPHFFVQRETPRRHFVIAALNQLDHLARHENS